MATNKYHNNTLIVWLLLLYACRRTYDTYVDNTEIAASVSCYKVIIMNNKSVIMILSNFEAGKNEYVASFG